MNDTPKKTRYNHLAGFITNLTDKLADVDTDLPIPEQHIAFIKSRLADGEHTHLRIFDGTQIEYVKLTNTGGNLRLTRGVELSLPRTFPVGSCVKWELVPDDIFNIICQMPCCGEV